MQAFADGLINMIPTQGSVVQSGQAMLDVSVTNAITVYNVACTPVFPIIGQICVNLPI
ncbi:hypothetical protein CALVIDRAFT_533887 [Calocera viscosa TUFC12733]|uniref:Uncharacterized protein n=1 Tax=Calocera viscosa (strain TUFC12733) TaxID=1330018 RepID=A0A167QU50_CALVF|nr:hypothetical protein CALVIDRAFT_533887 [Calocera viscosa TUFC12733]